MIEAGMEKAGIAKAETVETETVEVLDRKEQPSQFLTLIADN